MNMQSSEKMPIDEAVQVLRNGTWRQYLNETRLKEWNPEALASFEEALDVVVSAASSVSHETDKLSIGF